MLLFTLILGICSCTQHEEEEFLLDINGLNGDSTGIDLDGYECVIIQNYDLDHPFQYPIGTLMSDMYLQRLADISEEYNCNVTIQQALSTDVEGEMVRIFADVYVGEIACTHRQSVPAAGGCFYPLDVLKEYIDYTNADKFGSLGRLEVGIFNGVPYTVSPVAWPGKQASYAYSIFAVNEGTISRYGKTDPREYVENGEWTWETFENVLPDYHIVDGEYTSTAMNLTWSIVDFAMMNGANYVSVNSDGTVVPALDSPAIVETFDWCSNLFTKHKDCISYLGHYEMVEAFIRGEITLAQTSFTHMINEMIYDVDNYGVVPMPCGPRGTYGEWASAYADFDSMAIWVNAKEPEAAAMVINRMFDPFEGYETLEDIQEYASGIFYDQRDIEFFTTYLKHTRWNYYTRGLNDYFSNAGSQTKSGKSGTEIVEKYASAANEIVEKYVIPNYEFIQQYESATKK